MATLGLRRKKTLIDHATEFAEAVIPKVESAVDEARVKAAPVLAEARDRAVPLLNDARDQAGPLLAQGRALAAEKVAVGAALASEKAEAARTLATEKAAELSGQPPKKRKRGKLKALLLLGGLAGIVAVVARRLRVQDDWESSYQPTPAPTSTAPGEEEADDAAAASPDEALADATETPHRVSTPDDPVEVVEVEESRGSHKA